MIQSVGFGGTLVVAVLILIAGCQTGLTSTKSPTSTPAPVPTIASPTPTATSPPTATAIAPSSFEGTKIDAEKFESELSTFATVDVNETEGGLSVFWVTNTTDVEFPNALANVSKLAPSQQELVSIVTYYMDVIANGQLHGTLSLTAVNDGERIAVWTIDERWVHQFDADVITAPELMNKIRESRYDFKDEPSTPAGDSNA